MQRNRILAMGLLTFAAVLLTACGGGGGSGGNSPQSLPPVAVGDPPVNPTKPCVTNGVTDASGLVSLGRHASLVCNWMAGSTLIYLRDQFGATGAIKGATTIDCPGLGAATLKCSTGTVPAMIGGEFRTDLPIAMPCPGDPALKEWCQHTFIAEDNIFRFHAMRVTP